MKRTLILLAGPPATGKSYFIQQLRQYILDFFLISPDEVKEMLADKKGFNNLLEKEALENEVWKFFYDILERYMSYGKKVVVSEYPFSDKQKPSLIRLATTYRYQIITIRLIADFEVLWSRRADRDRQADRHLSHIMTHYHEGDELLDRSQADNHITKEVFYDTIKNRNYFGFKLGKTYEIDVTDYASVNYCQIMTMLIENIN